jgi:hypothetical protein
MAKKDAAIGRPLSVMAKKKYGGKTAPIRLGKYNFVYGFFVYAAVSGYRG